MLAQIMSKYYFSEDKQGTGIKTYKWLESKMIELLARMRGDKNEMFQSAYLRDLAQGKMSFLPAAVGTEPEGKGGKDKGKGDKGKAAKGDAKGGKSKGKAKGGKNGGKGGRPKGQPKGEYNPPA